MAISAYLFGPSSDATGTALARAAAENLRNVIRASIANARTKSPSRNTALKNLIDMSNEAGSRVTDDVILGQLFGMAMGFIPTNVLAGGNMLETLLRMPEFLERARAAAVAGDDDLLWRCLREALRFRHINPGPWRICPNGYVFGAGGPDAIRIQAGSKVLAIIQSAMFDTRRIERPHVFDPERRDEDYMVFGVGQHGCLGAYIAKAQITQTFKPLLRMRLLEAVDNPRVRTTRFNDLFPLHLKVGFFSMTQSWVTVVVRFSALRVDYVDQALDGLGDAANRELAQLDAAAFIHFIEHDRGTGVPRRAVRPPGDRSEHGRARASGAGEAVGGGSPILCWRSSRRPESMCRRASCVLAPSWRHAGWTSIWAGWQSLGWFATTGLEFSGIAPGMSVRRILDEARLAARSRRLLERGCRRRTRPWPGWSACARASSQTPRSNGPSSPNRYPCFGEGRSLGDSLRPLSLAALRDFLLPLVLPPVLVILYARLVQALPLDRALWRFLLTGIIELLLALMAIGIGYWTLRRQEIADVPFDAEPDEAEMREILARENRPGYAQNHLACVSFLKPGWVRRVTLRLALWLIGENRAHISKPGFIDKIGTIHFARWFRIPGTDRLVFLSNYDGSWQSYLEDFIARLREGLTSVWSNTRDFPKTANLATGGAGDGARFKRWARRQQVPTRFWYTRLPASHHGPHSHPRRDSSWLCRAPPTKSRPRNGSRCSALPRQTNWRRTKFVRSASAACRCSGTRTACSSGSLGTRKGPGNGCGASKAT